MFLLFFGSALTATQHFCKFGSTVYGATNHCNSINTTRCKYFATGYSGGCGYFTTATKCNAGCSCVDACVRVAAACGWNGTACVTSHAYSPWGMCVASTQGTSCVSTTCLQMAYEDVPEFFGFEFNEMEISTGIIALLAAIVLPMALFRKKSKQT